jgi:hypothetical protein
MIEAAKGANEAQTNNEQPKGATKDDTTRQVERQVTNRRTLVQTDGETNE